MHVLTGNIPITFATRYAPVFIDVCRSLQIDFIQNLWAGIHKLDQPVIS